MYKIKHKPSVILPYYHSWGRKFKTPLDQKTKKNKNKKLRMPLDRIAPLQPPYRRPTDYLHHFLHATLQPLENICTSNFMKHIVLWVPLTSSTLNKRCPCCPIIHTNSTRSFNQSIYAWLFHGDSPPSPNPFL